MHENRESVESGWAKQAAHESTSHDGAQLLAPHVGTVGGHVQQRKVRSKAQLSGGYEWLCLAQQRGQCRSDGPLKH